MKHQVLRWQKDKVKTRNETRLMWDKIVVIGMKCEPLGCPQLGLRGLQIWTDGDGFAHVQYEIAYTHPEATACIRLDTERHILGESDMAKWLQSSGLPLPKADGGVFRLSVQLQRKQAFCDWAMEFARGLGRSLRIQSDFWYESMQYSRMTKVQFRKKWMEYGEYLLKKYKWRH